jgi:chromosome segregation protein
MHPGAVWKRVDFQIHTPRDPQWSGSPHLPGGTEETEAAREAWADGFVAKCIQLKLDAVAITDHHDFCFVEYVQRACERLPKEIVPPWVLPGVEVTCRDAVQCLILFDTDSEPELWHRLFGGHLQNTDVPDGKTATNPQAMECGRDIESFIESVTADAALRGRSIILPHASNENAHKSIMRKGFAPRFRDLPFDGVYSDKPFQSLDHGIKQKIYGHIKEWGTRRRGIIPTGDNRHQDFKRLGAHECWIRLGEPTSESVRQAVLADDARMAYEPPALPTQRILQLNVNSTLTGENFCLSFNDGFTALIGGRGSGKSAILEYLRFGLGRSATDTDGDEGLRSRDQQMISETLQHGSVSVVLERDGIVETWTRGGQQREISVVVEDGARTTLTLDAAQQRFRARGFYQKQLSTLVSDQTHTAEQITGIAAAEYIDRRRLVDRDIAAAKREIKAAFQRLVEFWVADAEHKQSVASIADLRRRIESVKTRIGDAGVSPEHQMLLEAAPGYKQLPGLAEEATRSVADDIALVEKQLLELSSLKTTQWTEPAKQFRELEAVIDATETARSKVEGAARSAIDALQEMSKQHIAVFSDLAHKRERFDMLHAEAVAQQVNAKALLDEANHLNDELQVATAGERKSLARLEALKGAPEEFAQARDTLANKVEELRAVLTEAAAQVQAMSEGSLRAAVRREETPKQYLNALLAICDRNRIRDVQMKCEDRARQLVSDELDETWESVTTDLLTVYKHKVQTRAHAADRGSPIGKLIERSLLGQVTPQQLRTLYDSINDDEIVKMLVAVREDFISFEYRDGKNYIPFAQASPGQQASALLHLLLNQEAGTLLIDQPEDDLDNRVIVKLAALIQKTKRKRQLVFATHNPNFVVNGDADKIVVLNSGSGDSARPEPVQPRVSVDVDGAIETLSVRSAITETMEGGQAAFELRSRKYSFPAPS